MSAEQIISSSTLPEAALPPREAIYFTGEFSGKEYTHAEYTAAVQASVTKSPATYREYVEAGESSFETARLSERSGYKASAIKHYREASVSFLGALGTSPLEDISTSKVLRESNCTTEFDPFVLLQYARCLSKQLEFGAVQHYREPSTVADQIEKGRTYEERTKEDLSFHNEREKNLERIMIDSFRMAWRRIKEAPAPKGATAFAGTVVVVESLRSAHRAPEAETILEEATELFINDEDTDPKLQRFFEKPLHEKLSRAHDLLDHAFSDLAHDSQTALAVL